MQHFKDDLLYYEYAEQILEQNIFVLNIDKFEYPTTHHVGPGIPWILSGIFYLIFKNWLLVFIVNSIVSTFFCWLIYRFAKRIFGYKYAIVSLVISTFYVLYLKVIPTSGKEVYISLLLLSVIYAISELFFTKKVYKQVVIISLIFTALLFVDERYFAYIPLFMFFIFAFIHI